MDGGQPAAVEWSFGRSLRTLLGAKRTEEDGVMKESPGGAMRSERSKVQGETLGTEINIMPNIYEVIMTPMRLIMLW